jgi:hypothetical protein
MKTILLVFALFCANMDAAKTSALQEFNTKFPQYHYTTTDFSSIESVIEETEDKKVVHITTHTTQTPTFCKGDYASVPDSTEQLLSKVCKEEKGTSLFDDKVPKSVRAILCRMRKVRPKMLCSFPYKVARKHCYYAFSDAGKLVVLDHDTKTEYDIDAIVGQTRAAQKIPPPTRNFIASIFHFLRVRFVRTLYRRKHNVVESSTKALYPFAFNGTMALCYGTERHALAARKSLNRLIAGFQAAEKNNFTVYNVQKNKKISTIAIPEHCLIHSAILSADGKYAAIKLRQYNPDNGDFLQDCLKVFDVTNQTFICFAPVPNQASERCSDNENVWVGNYAPHLFGDNDSKLYVCGYSNNIWTRKIFDVNKKTHVSVTADYCNASPLFRALEAGARSYYKTDELLSYATETGVKVTSLSGDAMHKSEVASLDLIAGDSYNRFTSCSFSTKYMACCFSRRKKVIGVWPVTKALKIGSFKKEKKDAKMCSYSPPSNTLIVLSQIGCLTMAAALYFMVFALAAKLLSQVELTITISSS